MGFESFPKFEEGTEPGEKGPELTPELAIREEKEALEKRGLNLSGKAKAALGAFILMTAIGCKEGKFEGKTGEGSEGGRPAAVGVEEGARPDRAKVVRTQEFSGYGIRIKTGFNKYGEIVYQETPYGNDVLISR